MNNFKYALIAAVSKGNGVIGLDNTIPWEAPMDMAYFKKKTTDNVVIMGRKTYESIGKALPNRINIVVTSDSEKIPKDYCGIIVNNMNEALKVASTFKDKETFVIGGGRVYIETMENAHKVYLTWVSRKDGGVIEGNRYFADFHEEEFNLVDKFTYNGDETYKLEFNTFIRK